MYVSWKVKNIPEKKTVFSKIKIYYLKKGSIVKGQSELKKKQKN